MRRAGRAAVWTHERFVRCAYLAASRVKAVRTRQCLGRWSQRSIRLFLKQPVQLSVVALQPLDLVGGPIEAIFQRHDPPSKAVDSA